MSNICLGHSFRHVFLSIDTCLLWWKKNIWYVYNKYKSLIQYEFNENIKSYHLHVQNKNLSNFSLLRLTETSFSHPMILFFGRKIVCIWFYWKHEISSEIETWTCNFQEKKKDFRYICTPSLYLRRAE
jgi:hypothetical protein